jgi:hypothetical protein
MEPEFSGMSMGYSSLGQRWAVVPKDRAINSARLSLLTSTRISKRMARKSLPMFARTSLRCICVLSLRFFRNRLRFALILSKR